MLQLVRNEFSDCQLIIHGDFNLDLLKCITSRHCSEFVSFMHGNSLFPTILRPTRIEEASATLIDNIWRTATPDDRLHLSGIVMTNITDHYSVFNVIEVEEAIVESTFIEINKRMLKDENMSILSERIRSYEWKNIERLNNVEEAYKEFNDNIFF